MARSPDSPQSVWQQQYYLLAPYSQSPSSWWYNPTNHASLRLTHKAYLTIRKHIKFYKFELPDAIKPRAFLQLERYFAEPYYVQNHKTIHITSERDSIMLSLHANNLQQYLDNQDQ